MSYPHTSDFLSRPISSAEDRLKIIIKHDLKCLTDQSCSAGVNRDADLLRLEMLAILCT